MEKYVPYEKLSKKKKRERNQTARLGWGKIKPVTRKSPDPKVYNRKKARAWEYEDNSTDALFLCC